MMAKVGGVSSEVINHRSFIHHQTCIQLYHHKENEDVGLLQVVLIIKQHDLFKGIVYFVGDTMLVLHREYRLPRKQ